ncbi:7350_t:CDS:2 [Paraglomus brasilianum]|uniref:7350_t:CDS:1 n=1 Tax=Paraglomus brasilianum TaxID=144538 RepID=A0A9N8ZKL6_9GLOM|nr:7350_t:CDS:2 [Paraglomus brasilianum]
MVEAPQRFEISVSDSVLDDLKERLEKARYPDELEGVDWEYGTPVKYLKEYVAFWQHHNWKEVENKLNQLPQFKLTVNGLEHHHIHKRSFRANAIPLILIHGWPGSFYEFAKIANQLAEPEGDQQAFHVVVPSLPGYGFSEKPKKRGYGVAEMAKGLNELMVKLGYKKYFAHGGDWGTIIAHTLASCYPSECVAIHITCILFPPPPLWSFPLAHLKFLMSTIFGAERTYGHEEAKRLERFQTLMNTEMGYFHAQTTKPQTLAYGLNDSPIGLLAWILEKYHTWTDRATFDLSSDEAKEAIVTTAMLYWVTETIPSSMRIYKEFRDQNMTTATISDGAMTLSSKVPTGIAFFPCDFPPCPKEWAECYTNIQRWKKYDKGGHFPGLECPDVLTNELREYFGLPVIKKAFSA